MGHYWLTPVHVRYEINRKGRHLLQAIVWRLPRNLVYWCAIRVISAAITGPYSNTIVPELTAIDALKRWDEKRI